jgi:predicted Zn-dependent protease
MTTRQNSLTARVPSPSAASTAPPQRSRFLSQAECTALFERARALATGGGDTQLRLESKWTGNVRYARNQITSSGDTQNNPVTLTRAIRGAAAAVQVNQIDDVPLEAAVRRAERLVRLWPEISDDARQMAQHFTPLPSPKVPTTGFRLDDTARDSAMRSLIQSREEPFLKPHIFFDSTFNLDAASRAAAVKPLVTPAAEAGMLAAGYIEVSARGRTVMDSVGLSLYYPYTTAQYSVTVRDPKGRGSGWAGVDWNDWTRVDAQQLSAIALDKCLKSRDPVAVEPGRYVAILEPQAVCDLCASIMKTPYVQRQFAESGRGPYAVGTEGGTKIGERIFDPRITISADPMDPDLGFVPFDEYGHIYHPATWVEHGVLKELAYPRSYGIANLGKNTGLPSNGAFRMSGGTVTIDEMIAGTKRGVLVTRFSSVAVVDESSLLSTGYTRDGLWLIENGKISKSIKNFRFTESPMFILNNVEQLGAPRRVFHPAAPIVVPPLKVRDFSFTSLSDAV